MKVLTYTLLIVGDIIVFLVSYFSIHKAQINFVYKTSAKLSYIMELRSRLVKYTPTDHINHAFTFERRTSAVNFNYQKGFIKYMLQSGGCQTFSSLFTEIDEYNKCSDLYSYLFKEIQNYDCPSFSNKTFFLNKTNYRKLENKLYAKFYFEKKWLSPSLDIEVLYSSPQGRSTYQNDKVFYKTEISSFLRTQRIAIAKYQVKSIDFPSFIEDKNFKKKTNEYIDLLNGNTKPAESGIQEISSASIKPLIQDEIEPINKSHFYNNSEEKQDLNIQIVPDKDEYKDSKSFYQRIVKPEEKNVQVINLSSKTEIVEPSKTNIEYEDSKHESIIYQNESFQSDFHEKADGSPSLRKSNNLSDIYDLIDEPFLFLHHQFIKTKEKSPSLLFKDFANMISLLGFSVNNTSTLAVNRKFRSLEDAIYRNIIIKTQAKDYYYSNPDDLKEYDAALKSLVKKLVIFEGTQGTYKTRFWLKDISSSVYDVSNLSRIISEYVNDIPFFTLNMVTKRFEDNPFIKNAPSTKAVLNLISRNKTIHKFYLDSHGNNILLYVNWQTKENPEKTLIENAMAGPVKDIYVIQKKVETTYEEEYDLDKIGRDAQKAGYYYSDDLEKVYSDKKDYLKEVYGK